MVTRARSALAEGGELAAMLWFQGEADTMNREDAELYQGRLEALVRDVRRDLICADLIVIEVIIPNFLLLMNLASRWVDYSISPAQVGIATAQYNGKFLNRVRKAQKAVSSRLPNVMLVDAMGLPIASDYTHLTTQAQVQLGSMLAKAYLSKL
jgi:hypothetical protein